MPRLSNWEGTLLCSTVLSLDGDGDDDDDDDNFSGDNIKTLISGSSRTAPSLVLVIIVQYI